MISSSRVNGILICRGFSRKSSFTILPYTPYSSFIPCPVGCCSTFVKLYIDMRIELADIPNMPSTAWRPIYKVKALVIDGDREVLADLEGWRKSSKNDYNRIMTLLRLVVESPTPVRNPHVKSDRTGSGIYELSAYPAGVARLFFFYDSDDTLVVITNSYWKNRSSRKRQEQAFAEARYARQVYLDHKGEISGELR